MVISGSENSFSYPNEQDLQKLSSDPDPVVQPNTPPSENVTSAVQLISGWNFFSLIFHQSIHHFFVNHFRILLYICIAGENRTSLAAFQAMKRPPSRTQTDACSTQVYSSVETPSGGDFFCMLLASSSTICGTTRNAYSKVLQIPDQN